MKLLPLLLTLAVGIIPPDAPSPLVPELASALHQIGLYKYSTAEVLEPRLLAALNSFRRSSCLPEAPYCDPASLRALGIQCAGDELMLLARYAESVGGSETARFDLCRQVLEEARDVGITLHEAVASRCNVGELLADVRAVSGETIHAVILAAASVG
ncbi:MAG: hypothetical protein IJ493_02590 [Clostridia bacterium]|nr:hypothetical protein [Clostridia bacterium]